MDQRRPPFPAHADDLSAAAEAGYAAAAPGYWQVRAPYGFPTHDYPNSGFHGVLPGYSYAARGHPSPGRFEGAVPGYAYGNHPMFTGGADAAPGQGQIRPHLTVDESHQVSVGLDPGARFFVRHDTGGQQQSAIQAPFQDPGGALNFGDGCFDRHASRQASEALNSGAPSFDRHASRQASAAPSFNRHSSRQAGGALNPGAPSFYHHASGQAGGAPNPVDPYFEPQNSGEAGGAQHHEIGSNSKAPPVAHHFAGAAWLSSDLGAHLRGLQHISFNPGTGFDDSFADVEVREVWRDNCLEAFEEIKEVMANLKGGLYIAIDLEYLAAADTDIDCMPFTSDQWYSSLQEYVNNGSVVQIGLAFASQDLSSGIVVYEINLMVDATKGTYHEKVLEFLARNKHDLTKHKQYGIIPEWIYAGVLQNLPFGSENVVWLAYHGDRDVAFILKLLEGGGSRVLLPPSLASFLYRVKEEFPMYYDVRVLSQLVEEGFRGKLTDLAGQDYLKLNRIGGAHHAGSDALLTLQCFAKILQDYELEAVVARKCMLSGIDQQQLPLTCYRSVNATDVYVVDVYRTNFDHEALYISQAIASNFRIIGIQIVEPQNLPDYATIRTAVQEIKSYEILLAFMNPEGNLAYGRSWKVFLKVGDEDETRRVSTLKLAALLATSGASHDTRSTWVTYGGAYVLACLLQSFITPAFLPVSSTRYKVAQENLFPKVLDVKTFARSGLEFNGHLSEIASQLGVAVDDCDVVTILRCFYSLRAKCSIDIDDQS